MFSGVFAGKTVSMCALSETYRRPNPGCVPNTLPTSSMRTSSSPTSRKRSASQAPRADSPNGGAAIRAISICQCESCGSCVRNQLNADRTSGEAASRATSCCTVGARSDKSARGGVGLMRSIASSYNAPEGMGIGKRGNGDYRRAVTNCVGETLPFVTLFGTVSEPHIYALLSGAKPRLREREASAESKRLPRAKPRGSLQTRQHSRRCGGSPHEGRRRTSGRDPSTPWRLRIREDATALRMTDSKTRDYASVLPCRLRHALQNLRLAEGVVAGFGSLVDALHQIVLRRDAAPLQPEQHIRLPAHRTDINNLLQPKH